MLSDKAAKRCKPAKDAERAPEQLEHLCCQYRTTRRSSSAGQVGLCRYGTENTKPP